MSESKHTPGPWTLDAGKHRMWICRVGNNPDDPEIWSAHENKEGIPWPFGDKHADALLIAAAPDMLEALKDALLCMESATKIRDPNWDGSATLTSPIGVARTAIAKAEGR